MTNWLKWRLCALFGTTLLVGGATYLQAQNSYPAPPKTPEEAGEQFFKLLSTGAIMDGKSSCVPFNWPRAAMYLGSISRVQMTQLSNRSQNGGPEELFAELAQEMNAPQFEAQIASTSGNQTIVQVSPSTTPKSREVVVIAEDGGYRVDLKATYARWSHLSEDVLDQQWYRYTGEVTPALRQSSNFIRSQCQSNLKQQMLGVFQYAQDYDEKLPPARKWIDVLKPYIKSEQVFKCPALSGPGNGYAYNQNLSQYPQPKMSNIAYTVNIYEVSNLGRNVFGPGTGRAYRHDDGWNLGFADGHVKYFKRTNPNPLQFKP